MNFVRTSEPSVVLFDSNLRLQDVDVGDRTCNILRILIELVISIYHDLLLFLLNLLHWRQLVLLTSFFDLTESKAARSIVGTS